MPAIIASFEYSGTDYLDKRVSFSSLTALETQTDIKFPNGFECWCESEQTWYQLSTTNPDDISTYIWSERPSGDATIIVDGVQTSDYKFVITVVDGTSTIGTKELSMKFVTVEEALIDYETLVSNISDSDLSALETKKDDLEKARQTAKNAIDALP